jgi:hypothetical protein
VVERIVLRFLTMSWTDHDDEHGGLHGDTNPLQRHGGSFVGGVASVASSSLRSVSNSSTPLWLEAQAQNLHMAFSYPTSELDVSQRSSRARDEPGDSQVPSSSCAETIGYYDSTSTGRIPGLETPPSQSPRETLTKSPVSGVRRISGRLEDVMSQPSTLEECVAAEVIQGMYRRQLSKRKSAPEMIRGRNDIDGKQ